MPKSLGDLVHLRGNLDRSDKERFLEIRMRDNERKHKVHGSCVECFFARFLGESRHHQRENSKGFWVEDLW